MRVQEVERAGHAHAALGGDVDVLVAVQEVLGRHGVRDDRSDRIAELDAPVVLGGAPRLLRERHGRDTEAPDAAIRGVELGARAW